MAQKKKIMMVGPEARSKVIAGANYLSDAVKLTLGPKGRNFASGIRGGSIAISNDGVSLAKEIQGRDEFEDIGVRAVREAATKTNEKAGDGTTTAVVLTQAIIKSTGFEDEGAAQNFVDTMKKIEKESEEVVKRLTEMAVPIKDKKHIINVAKVSVEDEKLAELIGGAQWEVGHGGTVMAEEHNSVTDEVEYIYGVRIDNGFGTSRIANNPQKQALELSNVRIIVTSKIFNKAKDVIDLKPLFESLVKEDVTELVLLARAFDQTAIDYCTNNLRLYFEGKSGLAIFPINAPYTDMEEIMEDLAAVTGSKYIGTGRNTVSMTTKDVGVATKIFCTRYEGIITGQKRGTDERIDALVDARVTDIKEKLKGKVTPFEKRGLEARLSQLTAGTAIVKVGAETEQERRHKKDKVDDAVNAVKAAMQEGVVPGAGKALMAVADAMPKALISNALRAPYQQIMLNAGGEFEVPAWVQDPLKVVRTAFEKASSIARSLATTEIVVTFEDERPMWVQEAKTNSVQEES